MKRIALYFVMAATLVASCSTQEKNFATQTQDDVLFHASFEPIAEDGTKVYANEDLLLRWTTDDRVSIFNKITYNQEYRFIGQTGDYEGGFNKVDDPEFMTGKAIPHVISVYPFQRQTRVSESEVVTLTLPEDQIYAQNSFGLGANTMVSVSSGNLLQFKSVGGFLVISLFGEGVSVESITLKGNNGEKLAGEANVTMPLDGVPSAVMADNATTEITLYCESPVQLGASEEESVRFWFVVPPVTFSKGFTITVREFTGEVIEKSTSKSIAIERNRLSKMVPIEVERRIVLSQRAFDVPAEGGNFTLGIAAPAPPIIGELPGWISYTSNAYQNESIIWYYFTIDRNFTNEPRTATVSVSADGVPDESFTISQEGGGALVERYDWSVRYVAREDWVNDDGSVDRVEHFKFLYNGNGYYIVRMIRPDDLRNVYNNDLAAFFTYEAEMLLNDARADGVNFWQYTGEVFGSSITDIYFNRLRSGSWVAFLIELNTQGNVTGQYAESSFTIQQEVATDAFSKWLGNWRVSNGLMGYDLSISSIDNNFIYRIDGWEWGPSVSFQMDQEYLEGEFWAPDGRLYITSQYLGTYNDDKLGTVDELFLGNIMESNGLTVVIDEGIDLAMMVPKGDDTAELQPVNVTINNGSSSFTTKFHSMQYYMWDYQNREYHPYNSNVAELPLTMTRLAGTRAEVVTSAKPRTASKASIHHSQPKAGQSARKSTAKTKSKRSLSPIKD